MPLSAFFITATVSFFVFAVFHKLGRNRRCFRRSLLSLLIGPAALLAVNLSSAFTGVSLTVSPLSLSVAAAGGIPGITALLILNLFF